MTKEEFVQRFTAQCLSTCGFTHFNDGTLVTDYCQEVALSYWDDEDRRADGPEDCADEDMTYWGKD